MAPTAESRNRKLLLATGNQHKLREMREILAPYDINVVAPSDVGYDPNVIEDGATFEANAIKKAQAGCECTGLWTLADDSGIEARALDWRPGVHSARYAGEPCDDAANNRKLVRELASHADKFVQYRCVIALAPQQVGRQREGQASFSGGDTLASKLVK